MVSLDSVVSEALLIIGASGDDEVARPFAQQAAWRAISDFPVSEEDIKVCTITAKNLMLKKPEDMHQFLEVALYDANGCFIPHVFHAGKKRIYPNTESYSYTVTTDTGDVTYHLPVDLSEDRTSFFIGTNGTNVSYAQVRYFAWPMDSSGYPMIREEEVLTCMYFIRFMWSLRKNENQSEIQQNERLYKIESDRCRARRKAADLSQDKIKTILASMNKMIPNFNRSRF